MQMFVYKRAGGLTGVAAFLVDRGVVGLKDAWVRIDIDHAEFENILEDCRERGIRMVRADAEQLRHWVAGGMRWAHENGMRLPKDWNKSASLIGGLGDWQSADVSEFVKEFAGHPEDLRQRLIGQPLETYLKRDDIEFVFSNFAPYMDHKTGEYENDFDGLNEEEMEDTESIASQIPVEELQKMADQFTAAATALAGDTAAWLQGRGIRPEPELFEAWRSVMLAAMISKTAMPDAPEEDVADFGFELLQDMSARIEDSRFAEYDQSVGQVLMHLETDTLMMQKAVLVHGVGDDALATPLEADKPAQGN